MYVDDHTVFFKKFKDEMEHLHQVVKMLIGSEVTLKLKKRSIFVEVTDYLGHTTRP